MAIKKEIKVKIIDFAIFTILLLIYAYFTLKLFRCQSVAGTEGYYISDIMAYIRHMLGTEEVYSFPYPIMFWIGRVFNLFMSPEFAMAASIGSLNLLAVIVTKLIINYLINDDRLIVKIAISLTTLALFMTSMIFSDFFARFGIKAHYLGVFTTTPWHNGTYIAARPFMILAFFWGARVLNDYEAVNKTKSIYIDEALFSLFMLLVTMTKPSYTLPHLAAAGLVMLYRFAKTKGKNFKDSCLLAACYVPTLIALLYQYSGVFVAEASDTTEKGIGFGFKYVWGVYCDNIPLAIVLACAFPISVLVFNYKKLLSNQMYRFSWQVYAAALFMALFMYEKGFRANDFNFAWGYMCGIFVVFLSSLVLLIEKTLSYYSVIRKIEAFETSVVIKALPLLIMWGCFGLHLICGLMYFKHIYIGLNYT